MTTRLDQRLEGKRPAFEVLWWFSVDALTPHSMVRDHRISWRTMIRTFASPKKHPRNAIVPPWRVRVVRQGYEGVDPLAIPWGEIQKHPANFPNWHLAKIDPARIVVGLDVETDRGTERLYVKRNPRRTIWLRLKYTVHQSKEWREWNVAEAMSKAGVWVPQPVFYGEVTEPSTGADVVYLATKALEPSWKEWRAHVKATKAFDVAWRSLAGFARRLHELQIYHADFRGDHLYFDATRVGVWEDLSAWALIDLDGSQVGRPVTRSQRERALQQLCESMCRVGMQRENFLDFVDLYDPDRVWRLDPNAIFDYASHRAKTR